MRTLPSFIYPYLYYWTKHFRLPDYFGTYCLSRYLALMSQRVVSVGTCLFCTVLSHGPMILPLATHTDSLALFLVRVSQFMPFLCHFFCYLQSVLLSIRQRIPKPLTYLLTVLRSDL